jgi:hypothetical protein
MVLSLVIARFESAEIKRLDLPCMDPTHPEPVPKTCPQHTSGDTVGSRDAGVATYPVMIQVGEEIIAETFRVLDVVRLDDEKESPLVGLLQGEPA